MSLSAVQAARDYVEDAVRRHVLAISPRTIASRLGCNDEQAVAVLKTLREDGYGVFHGYVHCPGCGETIALNATILIDMIREAGDLVGTTCRFCNETIALERDEVEVQLSFFLNAVANSEATASTSIAAASPSEKTAFPLRLLQAADQVNAQQIFVVQSGGTVTMQSHGDQSINKPTAQPDSAAANVEIAGQLEGTGERSSRLQTTATGRETYRHRKSRSGVMAFLFGQSEEERHREGQYNESASKSAHWTVRVGIVVVVVGAITIAVVLLVKLLH
jgi:hypothetical protein